MCDGAFAKTWYIMRMIMSKSFWFLKHNFLFYPQPLTLLTSVSFLIFKMSNKVYIFNSIRRYQNSSWKNLVILRLCLSDAEMSSCLHDSIWHFHKKRFDVCWHFSGYGWMYQPLLSFLVSQMYVCDIEDTRFRFPLSCIHECYL